MAPMVCLYAIPCPVPCYICFYLYTTNLVHIHIHIHVDINAVWPVIRYNTHTTQKLTHRERRVRVIIFIRRHHRRCDCRRCLHCGCCCLCCYCCCCFLIWYRFFAGCHQFSFSRNYCTSVRVAQHLPTCTFAKHMYRHHMNSAHIVELRLQSVALYFETCAPLTKAHLYSMPYTMWMGFWHCRMHV